MEDTNSGNNLLSTMKRLSQSEAFEYLEKIRREFQSLNNWYYDQPQRIQIESRKFHLEWKHNTYSHMNLRLPSLPDLYSITKIRKCGEDGRYIFDQELFSTLLTRLDPRVKDLFSQYPYMINSALLENEEEMNEPQDKSSY